jgi:diguanylate cyclase (GGDEF)-like protein/PAS domain S-box-containing protein
VNANELSNNSPLQFSSREEVERLCIENLLTAAEERVFFKDLEGRYLMVSAGWLAADAAGRSLEDVIGKSDFDIFSRAYAQASREEEQHVIASGNAVVAKVQRQTYDGRDSAWLSTTRVPLRSRDGSVIGTFGTTRDVTADVEVQDALAHRALHDPLTGLVNRVGLIDRLSQALVALQRRPGWVGLLFIDLDGFKQINDTLGHEAGDDVLVQVGRRLTESARKTDTVARLGGDELVVLCGELRESQCVDMIAERALQALRPPLLGAAAGLPFGASIGVACTSDPEVAPTELLRRADLAMYNAKRSGGGGYAVYDPARHARPRISAQAAGTSVQPDGTPLRRA